MPEKEHQRLARLLDTYVASHGAYCIYIGEDEQTHLPARKEAVLKQMIETAHALGEAIEKNVDAMGSDGSDAGVTARRELLALAARLKEER